VIKMTAEHFGMTVETLLSGSRKQPFCRGRQIAMFVARQVTSRSLPFIAGRLGKKDHTTVLYGVRVVKARVEAGDGATIAAVVAIMERLQVTRGRA
jgi:chromosomal replication initiator protein